MTGQLPRGVVPEQPGPGRQSVWDYPRPPQVVTSSSVVVVEFDGLIARTTSAVRVHETSHPPTWYLPRESFGAGVLHEAAGSSWCEFKGQASYLDVRSAAGRIAAGAAWTYLDPSPGFEAITGHIAVYAAAMDRITVAGVDVLPQPGGFYGGWITPDVVGPFKGGPGSSGW